MNASPAQNSASGLSGRKIRTLTDVCVRLVEEAREALFERGEPADRFLAAFFRSRRQFGSRDRRNISASVFAFFRWRGWLLKLDPNDSSACADLHLAAALAAEGAESPILRELLTRRFPGIDADALLSLELPEERIALLAGGSRLVFSDCDLVPDWMLRHVPERVRASWLHSLRTRPAVWLRSNRDPATTERLLNEAGVRAARHPHLPAAIRLAERNVKLIEFTPFRNGDFEVQDFSSQCIGSAAPVRPDAVWWDCCAGAGGKTLQIASRGAGRVIASDIRSGIMKEIVRRAERIPLRNIGIEELNRAASGRYDGVLADVPCSASGRWRRNPEMRWIFSQKELEKLLETQQFILRRAADSVAPGGFLVYGTCSVFQDENEDAVRRFLADAPGWSLHPFPDPVRGGSTDGMLRTLPGDADCDGSFVALLRKNGGNAGC